MSNSSVAEILQWHGMLPQEEVQMFGYSLIHKLLLIPCCDLGTGLLF
jgi:hypothetical protein